jgi:hypothetical protein
LRTRFHQLSSLLVAGCHDDGDTGVAEHQAAYGPCVMIDLLEIGSHNINEDRLRPALQALEGQNTKLKGLFDHLDFNRIGDSGTAAGAARLADQRLKLLIAHFGRIRLRTDDFEFADLLAAAYEYLIKDFADSAGRKGGEFYTPRCRCTHDGRTASASAGDAHLRPMRRFGQHAHPHEEIRGGARRRHH